MTKVVNHSGVSLSEAKEALKDAVEISWGEFKLLVEPSVVEHQRFLLSKFREFNSEVEMAELREECLSVIEDGFKNITKSQKSKPVMDRLMWAMTVWHVMKPN